MTNTTSCNKPFSKKKIAILISGTGSNMVSLIKAAQSPDYPAEIALVVTDKAEALGIEKAKELNIETKIIARKDFRDKKNHEEAIIKALQLHTIDIVCLAGYMRLLSKDFIASYTNRILNIHPSLLPLFPGLETHQKALNEGMKIAGCTVHIVTPEMDAGPIIAQAAIAIKQSDTVETLSARVLKAEHQLYPKALRYFIERDLSSLENANERFETLISF